MSGARNFELMLAGNHVPDDHFIAFSISRDMFQPDWASVALSNQGLVYSAKLKVGDELEILIGSPPVSVFKGDVVGWKAAWDGDKKTILEINAANKLNLMLRK